MLTYKRFLIQLRNDNATLADALAAIEQAAKRAWQRPLMPWFTDHSAHRHSVRVIDLALALVPDDYLPDGPMESRLNLVELYLLCAAAWLHDIGMNPPDAKPDALDAHGYEQIRLNHPAMGRLMILKEPARYGVTEKDQEVIGLLVQAHGTAFFENSLIDLGDTTNLHGQDVRLPTLAAMLLMADEMDLRSDRVETPDAAHEKFLPASLAHHYKHYYIRDASWRRLPNGRPQVALRFRFPLEFAEHDRDTMRDWVVRKLRRQIALIEPVLNETELYTALAPERRIVHETRNANTITVPPISVMKHVRAAVSRERIIDYHDTVRQMREWFESSGRVLVLEMLTSSGDSHAARNGIEYDLLNWMEHQLDADGYEVLGLTRAVPVVSVQDFVELCQSAVTARQPLEGSTRVQLQIGQWLRSPLHAAVVGGLALLDAEDLARLWNELLRLLLKADPIGRVVMIIPPDHPVIPPFATTIAVTEPILAELIRELRTVFSDDVAAQVVAMTTSSYGDLRVKIDVAEQLLTQPGT